MVTHFCNHSTGESESGMLKPFSELIHYKVCGWLDLVTCPPPVSYVKRLTESTLKKKKKPRKFNNFISMYS